MGFSELAQRLPRLWYRRQLSPVLLPLLPVSWLFALLVALRRLLYRLAVLPAQRLPVPVIVVGNLTVGGSGKTPLVLWLVDGLRQRGWRPGIISRGYAGADAGVLAVSADSDAAASGDEPLLLARRSGVPVFVGRDRAAAGLALLIAHPECNVIVSDDGLQHYALRRSVEIAVFDGRGAGNQHLLPVGPLREPLRRLARVSAVVLNIAGDAGRPPLADAPASASFVMRLHGEDFVALADGQRRTTAEALRGRRLYAIAGIGDPARFFAQLAALGLEVEARPFADHHRYSDADLAFARDGVLLMTEKDAVKCAGLNLGEAWVLPVCAQIDAPHDRLPLLELILERLDGRPFA